MKFFAFLTTLFFGLHTSAVVYAVDCVTPSASTQDSATITLSELYPAPASGEEEFIELFNGGSESIMLGGWLLSDESDKQYTIPDGTLLAAGAYIAFYHSTTGITLNNTGDIVTLYNAAGESRSSTEYDSTVNSASWSDSEGSWIWTTATPGSANAEESRDDSATSSETTDDSTNDSDATDSAGNDQTSPDIQLNELIPNPAGSDTTDEWIEVVNEGSTSVSLHNWQLTDQTTYYTIGNITIQPGEYMVFEVGDTNISLNNTGDTVYLIDPFGTIIHGTEYSNAAEAQTWARNGDTWEWTASPTPAEPNAFTTDTNGGENANDTSSATETQASESANNAMTIAAFRALEDNNAASVEGIVTVLPNIFGSQYFYIQDSSAGVQVYSYSKAFPELSEGDRVRVTGSKSTSRNETRIKTSNSADIAIIDHNATVEPVDVSAFEEAHEGMLVHIEGEVVERSGSTITIDNSLSVVIKSTTGISSSVFTVGGHVSIIGVEGQSDDSYRIMPRSTEDITQVTEDTSAWVQPAQAATGKTVTTTAATATQNPNTNQAVTVVGLLALAGVVLGVRYVLWHRKQKLAPTVAPVPYSDK